MFLQAFWGVDGSRDLDVEGLGFVAPTSYRVQSSRQRA